jgi:hypothetical protein
MPGGFTPAKGSLVPTNTVWFGGIADRCNFLTPNDVANLGSGGDTIGYIKTVGGAVISADYGNLWSIGAGGSLGATTAAPDGTTANSQLFVEDTSNGKHYLSTTIVGKGIGSEPKPPTGPLRLSGYFKNSGRRVVFQVFTGSESFGATGVYAIFDLAGAQIGVGPTFYTVAGGANSWVTPIDAQIVSVGGGWYRCNLDFAFTKVDDPAFAIRMFLDNGTGTAALSNSYTGNGSSGVYVWKTNLMPVGAYAINNQTYFNDFTSLATVDVNNTQAAGFDWYPTVQWPNFGWTQAPPSPGSYSIVGGTNLQILLDINPVNGIGLTSTTTNTPGVHVGNTWKPPFYWEVRHAIRYDLGTTHSGIFNVWSIAQDWIDHQGLFPTDLNPEPQYLAYGSELDFVEIQVMDAGNPRVGTHIGGPISLSFTNRNGTGSQGPYFGRGTPTFYPLMAYIPGSGVMLSGTNYVSNAFTIPGDTPPGAHWGAGSYPPPASSGQPQQPQVPFDNTQQHTRGFLFLPYYDGRDSPNVAPNSSAGTVSGSNPRACTMWTFIDGLMCGIGAACSPFSTKTNLLRAEGNSYPIFIGADSSPGVPIQIDWVQVTQ